MKRSHLLRGAVCAVFFSVVRAAGGNSVEYPSAGSDLPDPDCVRVGAEGRDFWAVYLKETVDATSAKRDVDADLSRLASSRSLGRCPLGELVACLTFSRSGKGGAQGCFLQAAREYGADAVGSLRILASTWPVFAVLQGLQDSGAVAEGPPGSRAEGPDANIVNCETKLHPNLEDFAFFRRASRAWVQHTHAWLLQGASAEELAEAFDGEEVEQASEVGSQISGKAKISASLDGKPVSQWYRESCPIALLVSGAMGVFGLLQLAEDSELALQSQLSSLLLFLDAVFYGEVVCGNLGDTVEQLGTGAFGGAAFDGNSKAREHALPASLCLQFAASLGGLRSWDLSTVLQSEWPLFGLMHLASVMKRNRLDLRADALLPASPALQGVRSSDKPQVTAAGREAGTILGHVASVFPYYRDDRHGGDGLPKAKDTVARRRLILTVWNPATHDLGFLRKWMRRVARVMSWFHGPAGDGRFSSDEGSTRKLGRSAAGLEPGVGVIVTADDATQRFRCEAAALDAERFWRQTRDEVDEMDDLTASQKSQKRVESSTRRIRCFPKQSVTTAFFSVLAYTRAALLGGVDTAFVSLDHFWVGARDPFVHLWDDDESGSYSGDISVVTEFYARRQIRHTLFALRAPAVGDAAAIAVGEAVGDEAPYSSLWFVDDLFRWLYTFPFGKPERGLSRLVFGRNLTECEDSLQLLNFGEREPVLGSDEPRTHGTRHVSEEASSEESQRCDADPSGTTEATFSRTGSAETAGKPARPACAAPAGGLSERRPKRPRLSGVSALSQGADLCDCHSPHVRFLDPEVGFVSTAGWDSEGGADSAGSRSQKSGDRGTNFATDFATDAENEFRERAVRAAAERMIFYETTGAESLTVWDEPALRFPEGAEIPAGLFHCGEQDSEFAATVHWAVAAVRSSVSGDPSAASGVSGPSVLCMALPNGDVRVVYTFDSRTVNALLYAGEEKDGADDGGEARSGSGRPPGPTAFLAAVLRLSANKALSESLGRGPGALRHTGGETGGETAADHFVLQRASVVLGDSKSDGEVPGGTAFDGKRNARVLLYGGSDEPLRGEWASSSTVEHRTDPAVRGLAVKGLAVDGGGPESAAAGTSWVRVEAAELLGFAGGSEFVYTDVGRAQHRCVALGAHICGGLYCEAAEASVKCTLREGVPVVADAPDSASLAYFGAETPWVAYFVGSSAQATSSSGRRGGGDTSSSRGASESGAKTRAFSLLPPSITHLSGRERIVHVNYADKGCCDADQKRSSDSAVNTGKVHESRRRTSDDLSEEFKRKNEKLLNYNRTAELTKFKTPTGKVGYYVWKPWVFMRELESLREGDILVYTDAGVVFLDDVRFLAAKYLKGADVAACRTVMREQDHSKRDAFVLLDMDFVASVGSTNQLASSVILARKSRESLAFARLWLEAAEDERIMTEGESVLFPDFSNYRNSNDDQTAMSIAFKKFGFHDRGAWFSQAERDRYFLLARNLAKYIHATNNWARGGSAASAGSGGSGGAGGGDSSPGSTAGSTAGAYLEAARLRDDEEVLRHHKGEWHL